MYVFNVFNQILILFLNVTLITYGKSDQIHVVYCLQILLIIVRPQHDFLDVVA